VGLVDHRSTFQIGDHVYHHTVLVLPAFHNLFLLGLDFFQANQWTKPSPEEDYFVLNGDQQVPFKANPTMLHNRYEPVITTQDRVIPAKKTITSALVD